MMVNCARRQARSLNPSAFSREQPSRSRAPIRAGGVSRLGAAIDGSKSVGGPHGPGPVPHDEVGAIRPVRRAPKWRPGGSTSGVFQHVGKRRRRQARIDLIRSAVGVDLERVISNRGRDVADGGVDDVCE